LEYGVIGRDDVTDILKLLVVAGPIVVAIIRFGGVGGKEFFLEERHASSH